MAALDYSLLSLTVLRYMRDRTEHRISVARPGKGKRDRVRLSRINAEIARREYQAPPELVAAVIALVDRATPSN